MENNMTLKKYAALLLLLLPTLTVAGNDNAYDLGDYVVYYNAFSADTLPPQMASAYGIVRSKYKGVLNLSIQKKQRPGSFDDPVSARVKVDAVNLAGQLKELSPRQVIEGKAIYYISEFRISQKEIITFKIELVPEGQVRPLTFEFKRQFYID
jgi:hypothetical protein|tara:strand:- start:14091 stop:14549 length:459 start_codon:yes stop_codon:yes gene_type:complete